MGGSGFETLKKCPLADSFHGVAVSLSLFCFWPSLLHLLKFLGFKRLLAGRFFRFWVPRRPDLVMACDTDDPKRGRAARLTEPRNTFADVGIIQMPSEKVPPSLGRREVWRERVPDTRSVPRARPPPSLRRACGLLPLERAPYIARPSGSTRRQVPRRCPAIITYTRDDDTAAYKAARCSRKH